MDFANKFFVQHGLGLWEGEGWVEGWVSRQGWGWVLVLGEVTPVVWHESGMDGGGVVRRWLG